MSAEQGQRIQSNCRVLWGDEDYELDIETNDWMTYHCHVRKDFGSHFGPPLIMTGECNSSEKAGRELDRMLAAMAQQAKTREPMTKAQKLEVFGGPNGHNRKTVGAFLDLLDKLKK
jgi:hypothetical protein